MNQRESNNQTENVYRSEHIIQMVSTNQSEYNNHITSSRNHIRTYPRQHNNNNNRNRNRNSVYYFRVYAELL